MRKTKQQRSLAAKKGWIKRRRTHKYKKEDYVAGGTIAGIGGFTASPIARKMRRERTWVRPNGQRVKIRDFKRKEVEEIRKGLSKVDSHVHPDVPLDLHDIRPTSKASIKYIREESNARHAMSYQPSIKGTHRRAKHLGAEVTPEMEKAMKKIGSMENAGRISIDREMVFKKRLANVEGGVVHEVGHAIDGSSFAHSMGAPFQRAAGWTLKPTDGGMIMNHAKFGETYARSAPWENFAEGFRRKVGSPSIMSGVEKAGGESIGSGQTLLPKEFLLHHPTAREKKYFDQFLHEAPQTVNAKVVGSLKNHVNKFAFGAAALTAGGAFAYKYKTDRSFKGRVDRKVRKARKKLPLI